MRVLAGDIGGTKTLLAIVDVDERSANIVVEQRYESAAYPGLAPIVAAFQSQTAAKFDAAGFGVAGAVIDRRSQTTNLPWTLDADALARELSLGPTALVNDFVAVALGILRLAPRDLAVLNPGTPVPRAPIAVLGAGTGLGEAFLVWDGARYTVVSSEGGHGDFAPRDALQLELWRYLNARHGHVSYERVVSGLGLRNIYACLRELKVAPESPVVRAALDRGEDLGAVVGQHALDGSDALCAATVDLFVSAYGAEAGNLALKVIARGGVYLAGGIVTKLLPRIAAGGFRAAYIDKGRFGPLVESMPAYAITHPRVGLIGAAVAATLQPA